MLPILAIDQGTTSTRALLFDFSGEQPRVLASAQVELPQHFPADGWVEHDAAEIWEHTRQMIGQVLLQAGLKAAAIGAIGITNQRETTVLWDRASGQPLHHAIVWQDRRTASACVAIRQDGHEPFLTARTGLLADPYFSATKLRWLLDSIPGARLRAARGELAFGTIDSWLVYKLTGGRVHATDATNASRTLLFNIHTQQWDPELLAFFDIPPALLPRVLDSAGDYGTCDPALWGSPVPVRAVVGDQQAAAVGQACLKPGTIKSTYGTGCFMLLNTGTTAVSSGHRLLTTVALRTGGVASYALEGSIFVAGAAVQWLRDGLHAIAASGEVETLAAQVPESGGVVVVPAFTGLGAPYWDPHARGAILGLTRDTGLAHIARATLESVAFQTMDLLEAMKADLGAAGVKAPGILRADGGMSRNDALMQMIADLTGLEVDRPRITETTALGAACLALLGGGFMASLGEISRFWQLDRRFVPQPGPLPQRWAQDWQTAIRRVRG